MKTFDVPKANTKSLRKSSKLLVKTVDWTAMGISVIVPPVLRRMKWLYSRSMKIVWTVTKFRKKTDVTRCLCAACRTDQNDSL